MGITNARDLCMNDRGKNFVILLTDTLDMSDQKQDFKYSLAAHTWTGVMNKSFLLLITSVVMHHRGPAGVHYDCSLVQLNLVKVLTWPGIRHI